MSYFHVLLRFQDDPQTTRCMFSDLSQKELQQRFVTPYQRGKNILCGGEVIEVLRIKTVTIIRTNDASEIELKRVQVESWRRIDELNRNSPLVFISAGSGYAPEDIDEAGTDVTNDFIHGPPGHGGRWATLVAVLSHGWSIVAMVIATVLAAIILWWFGIG